MASTAEAQAGHKRWVRRRRRHRWRPPARWLRAAAIGIVALAAIVASALLIHHWLTAPRPSRAPRELAASRREMAAGDISAARRSAARAVHDRPEWGQAHVMLATLDLAAGDGPAGDAELDGAVANGIDPATLHALRGKAQLLEGDPDRALSEVAQSSPGQTAYALRVKAGALALQGDLPAARATMTGWLGAHPDDPRGWTTLAGLRRQSGDVAGAIAAIGRALALDDHDANALTLKGELVRDQYGLAAALPWFGAALRVDPGNADALIAQAATLGDLGRYRDMLAASRRAIAARPNDPQPYYLQAVLAARAGNDALAHKLLRQTGGQLDDTPGVELLTGILALRAGADQQAIDALQSLVEQQPMNVTARRLLGAAQLRSGDADGALATLKPVALRDDADGYTLTLVARAFETEGKRDWAAAFLDRAASPVRGAPAPFGSDDDLATLSAAVEDSPGDPVAELGYIRGLIDRGDMKTALAQAQMLVAASPGAPAAQLILGDVLWAMKRPGDALTAYQRAADLEYDQPVMLRLVPALAATDHRAEAQRALALYLSQNPADLPARRLAAQWQMAAQDWDAAIDTLEGLRQTIGNGDAAILGELARAYTEDGDAATGRVYGRAAYRLAPMNPAICDAYGWALFNAGDRDGARQVLTKAASIAPGDAGIAAHLKTATAG